MRYSAEITSGSLKVPESRRVADLLLRRVTPDERTRLVREENILQARSRVTAEKLERFLRRRLQSMGPELWKLIRDGSATTATHACLACAVKTSPLLGDFMDLVLREEYRRYSPSLNKKVWEEYLAACRDRDPEMGTFSESTEGRLRSTVFQILAQAGYLENTKSLKLQPVHVDTNVLKYLRGHDEDYVLRCIQVSP